MEGIISLYGSTPAATDGFSWLSEDTPVGTLQWHAVHSSTRILSLNFTHRCCSVYPEESEDIIGSETQGFQFKRTLDPTCGVGPLSLMKRGPEQLLSTEVSLAKMPVHGTSARAIP